MSPVDEFGVQKGSCGSCGDAPATTSALLIVHDVELLVSKAKEKFREEFKAEAEVAVCAPGRVNLIGEHTDYNDGFVLPMALPLVTVVVGSKIIGDESIVVTTNEDVDDPKRVIIDMPKKTLICVNKPGKPKWANYVKGVMANYIGKTSTFLAVIVTNVPTGGGLSSSASLEVAMYTFLDALNGSDACPIMPTDKALACQKAEHDFAGMPCGIMDQFISVMGKQNNALLIDCRDLTSKLIPFQASNVLVLITNSNVKHELTGSEYSSRRKQCQEAAKLLKKSSLRNATMKDIDYLMSVNTDNDIIKRARHVVGEIERTEQAAKALEQEDFVKFGELMKESHVSLRDDFQVSCPELDQLVEYACEVEGVLGSRMTGGGFGGCTVTLVHNHSIDKAIANIKAKYKGEPTFYVCKPSEGARILESK